MTYLQKSSGAKTGASVVPVIVAQLVDFDALFVRRLMRHGLCHHRGLGVPLGRGLGRAVDDGRSKIEMLLQGKFGVVLAEDGERQFPRCRARGWRD